MSAQLYSCDVITIEPEAATGVVVAAVVFGRELLSSAAAVATITTISNSYSHGDRLCNNRPVEFHLSNITRVDAMLHTIINTFVRPYILHLAIRPKTTFFEKRFTVMDALLAKF